MTEDVLLADATALGREQMAAGDIADVHQVEAGVERREHPSFEEVHDHLTGRRRLDIPRADGRRGVHDDDRQARARELQRRLLGEELGRLVGSDHVTEADRRVLRSWRPVGGDSERADR